MSADSFPCPECGAEGDKLESVQHLLYYPPFVDAGGKTHTHDGNRIRTLYRCANGHMWELQSYHECLCGWTGGPPPCLVPAGKETFDPELREYLVRRRGRRGA